MTKDLWDYTLKMSKIMMIDAAHAKVLAEQELAKYKLREIHQRALADKGLTDLMRAKIWLAADPESVTAHVDPTADTGYRFVIPDGLPLGSGESEIRDRLARQLYPDDNEREAFGWCFESEGEP